LTVTAPIPPDMDRAIRALGADAEAVRFRQPHEPARTPA